MFRLIRLVVFMTPGIAGIHWLCVNFGFHFDWFPFIVAMGIAAVAAFLNFRVEHWWGAVTQPYRPQTVVHKTDETPAQVTDAAFRAQVLAVVLVAFPLAAGVFAVSILLVHLPMEYAGALALGVFLIIGLLIFLLPIILH